MTSPAPTKAFLATQVHWAMGRGLPGAAAEDVVFGAYEKASSSFDARRGAFEAYMQRIVRNDCAYWWRRQAVERRAQFHLKLVVNESDGTREERAHRCQEELLEALGPENRDVFAAWALQKHLGKGRVTSEEVSRSIGLQLSEYENAKKRLRRELGRLLNTFGWTLNDLLHGEDDVHRTG